MQILVLWEQIQSGNGNDFTENNISSQEQATDTPTNNFCTMNQGVNKWKYGIKEGGTSIWSNTGGGLVVVSVATIVGNSR